MKIAINGFGRIGRALFVLAKQRGFEVIYINDIIDKKQAQYLLQNDSIYGNNNFNLDDIVYTQTSNNQELNFENADLIFEATGVFTKKKQNTHYNKKVIITAPSSDLKPSIQGVREDINSDVISASSCTTNAIAPVISLLQQQVDIKKVSITVVHSYTSGQSLLDGQKKNDLRVARSGTLNIIPLLSSVTGELGKIYPKISFASVNVRVPVSNGMFLFLSIEVKKVKDKERLLELVTSQNNNTIRYTKKNLFSSQAHYFKESSIVSDFKILDETLLSLSIMQDNERAYASRVIDLASLVLNQTS